MGNNRHIKIGVFAPSSPALGEKTPETYGFLESKGIEVYEHPQVRKITGHTAGSIEERVGTLHELVSDKTIDILMTFWGGQNTNELLPYLDYELIKANAKPIVGYSDTTALLVAITKMTEVITYLGPAGITFTKPQPVDYTWDYFERMVIKGEEVEIKDSEIYADDYYFLNTDKTKRNVVKNEGRKVFRKGVAKGEIVAGNLQTLLVLAGTKYFPQLEGKILFLEEAEEESAGMIHRFFTHLTQVININKLGGVCIGRFCAQSKFIRTDTVEDMLKTVFGNAQIPIIYNLDFGHSDPMFTLPNGGYCELNTEEDKIVLSKVTL